MSYRSRVYRQRNPTSQEDVKEQPFFSGRHDVNKSKSNGAFFQPKLSVNRPGDSYEREADAAANAVVNKGNKMPMVQHQSISGVQRLSTSMEDEKLGTNDARMERDKEIQTKPMGEEDKEEKVSAQIEGSAGKGKSLPQKTLREMNASFGVDFSGVRVHNDGESANMNAELRAQAFTHGRDIYFNQGKYNPEHSAGKFLLAHELAHVVQQGGGRESKKVQRKPDDNHDLQSPRFKGEPDLEACFDDEARLTKDGQGREGTRKVEQGEAVRKVKEALIELGYLNGVADDRFTQDMWDAVKKLKSDKGLGWEGMGDVGPGTMAWLDDHFASKKQEPDKEDPPKEDPDKKRCGPDITKQLQDAQRKTRSHFFAWSTDRKETACQHLVSLIFGPGAWDIIDLAESGWISKDFRPDCASEGATPSCASSVQVDKECFYAGSVNYAHFGNMFDLCQGHYAVAYPLNKQFTENEMISWINFYKGTGPLGIWTPSANFKTSCAWASAGFFNWPSGALTPSGDRANCEPSCPLAYKGADFKVNWDGENF